MKLLQKTMYIFASIVFVGILILLFMYSTNRLILLLPIPIFIAFSFILQKLVKKNKLFYIMLFIIAFSIRLIVLLLLDIQPFSDFKTLLNASENLANGTNILNESSYFIDWAYQTGFVLYQTLILKIFNSVFALHILDCLFTSGICLLIYMIGTLINKNNNKLPSILYCLYIFAITYTGVLTNQHIFTFLTLVTIYLLLKKTKFDKYKNIIIGLLLGLANLLRPEGIVILAAILVYRIFQIKSKKDIKTTFVGFLVLLISYFAVMHISAFTIKITNINKNGLNNNDPLWKFVCGSDYESTGGYSERGLSVIGDRELEKSFIIENYKSLNFTSLLRFLKNKAKVFWTTDSYFWVFSELQNKGFSINKFVIYDSALYAFILISVIFSLIAGIKNQNEGKNLLIAILLVNFIVYLLIEVQARYSYTAKAIIFILAGDGILQILNILNYFKEKIIIKIKEKE